MVDAVLNIHFINFYINQRLQKFTESIALFIRPIEA